MKTKILSLIVACFMISCADKKKESIIMQNPNITADNFVKEVIKNMKHFPQEKVYSLAYANSYCFFEVSVNDLPIYKEFKYMAGSAFEINPCVFKSGKQKVFYKMYPIGKFEEDFFKTLRDNTYLELDLVSYDLKKQDDPDVTYSRYKTPMESVVVPGYPDPEEKSVARGKEYYEGSFEIDVNVPYVLNKPFEKGKDLTKIDKKELEAKVLKFYEKLKLVYANKEIDNIAKLNFDKIANEFYATYEKNEEIEKAWKGIMKKVNSSSFEMQPIENYKLQFYGDGKLVALISKSSEPHLRGDSALWAKYKDADGDLSGLKIKMLLYIPEGETEFKVY
jgi:hypothetical protein